MGTVGLSFGSPTSGTGFNVSSTVAEIVGNLQNVETPWKTQLTNLQAQDTAISSLGTLFSNLSNDMSSLTDLQGVLAEKTGSSSNTNVLTLTAATSTAVAGTHTVQVANLAQTSSGYLAPITNANDTLAGSVTLQAGSGTPLTLTLNSADNTLAGLASAINASGAGITASVLTDASGSRLSLVSGTSGANGNIVVSGNSILDTSVALAATVTPGSNSPAVTSSAAFAGIANSGDTLSGSLSVQVGSGTNEYVVIGAAPSTPAANTIYTGSGINTLAGVASAIQSAGIGVNASVVTNSDGTSSLSLVSQTAGSTGTLTVQSSILDTTQALGYTPTVTGKDANLTVDGIGLTSASNTVANLIPGVTFQLLAPSPTESDSSLEQVQVVIGNDNTGVESGMSQFVSDYNALISALNTQEGNNSSGSPEPLFGSPTLSLLQQQLLGGLNTANPNGSLASISTTNNTTLSGSISIQVGSGAAQTVTLDSTDNSISGLASAINAANIGVTAGVVTSNGESTLTMLSASAGANGALAVTSNIVASSDTPLSYTDNNTSSTEASGSLGSVPSTTDTLRGAVSIQVGSGAAQTINLDSTDNTLTGLADAINTANLGVTADVVTNNGISSIALVSGTPGKTGALTITSNLYNTTTKTSTTLNYTNSSDLGSLTGLGVSVNNDGTITFDAASLDSVLNSDYSSVVGFFQNANGWGQAFSSMLTNSGTTAGTGVLALASTSNSNMESTLNADISKEESLISAQQISLTNELNTANQIMQELPSQLQGVNELYSAITGYNQNTNG